MGNEISTDSRARIVNVGNTASDVDVNNVEGRDETFAQIVDFALKRNPNDQGVVDAVAAEIAKLTKFGKTVTGGDFKNKNVQMDEVLRALGIEPDAKGLKEALEATAIDKKRAGNLVEYNIPSLAANLVKGGLVSKDVLAKLYQVKLDDFAAYLGQTYTKYGKTVNSGNQLKKLQGDFDISSCSDKWLNALNGCAKSVNRKTGLIEYAVTGIAGQFKSYADADKIKGRLGQKEYLAAIADYSKEA